MGLTLCMVDCPLVQKSTANEGPFKSSTETYNMESSPTMTSSWRSIIKHSFIPPTNSWKLYAKHYFNWLTTNGYAPTSPQPLTGLAGLDDA